MRQRPHKENPQEKTKSSSWPTWNPLGSSKTTKSEQITSPLASPYSSEGLVRSEIDLSVIDPELRASGSKSPLSADSRRSVGDSSDWQDDQTMSPISIQDSDFSRKLGDTWDIPTTNGVGKTAKRSGMNGKSINFGEVDVVRGTPSFTASQLDTSDSELAALSNDLGSDITDEEQNDQIVTKSYGSGFPDPVSEEQKAPYFRPDSSSSVVKSTEPSRRAPSLFPSIGVSTALASGNQTPTGTMGPAASGDTASHQPDTLPSAPGENAEVRRGILKGSSYQAPAVPSDHDTSTQSDSEGRKDTRSGSKFTPKPSMNLRTSRSSPSRAESTYHPSRTGPKNRGLAFSKSRDTSRSRKSRGRPSKGMGPKCGVQFTNSSAQSRNPDPYYDSEQMTDDEEEASSVSAVASARRRVLPPSRLKTTGPSKTLRSREVALQKRMEYLPPKNPPLQSDTSPTDWKCSCFWW